MDILTHMHTVCMGPFLLHKGHETRLGQAIPEITWISLTVGIS